MLTIIGKLLWHGNWLSSSGILSCADHPNILIANSLLRKFDDLLANAFVLKLLGSGSNVLLLGGDLKFFAELIVVGNVIVAQ